MTWEETYDVLLKTVLAKHIEATPPDLLMAHGTPSISFEHAVSIAFAAYLAGYNQSLEPTTKDVADD